MHSCIQRHSFCDLVDCHGRASLWDRKAFKTSIVVIGTTERHGGICNIQIGFFLMGVASQESTINLHLLGSKWIFAQYWFRFILLRHC